MISLDTKEAEVVAAVLNSVDNDHLELGLGFEEEQLELLNSTISKLTKPEPTVDELKLLLRKAARAIFYGKATGYPLDAISSVVGYDYENFEDFDNDHDEDEEDEDDD